jgi:hypothetical protein
LEIAIAVPMIAELLRMTAGAAEQLRDVLGKALLAAQPTAGPAN